MKKPVLALLVCTVLILVAEADDLHYVYEIRELGASKTDPWSVNMVLITEAARLYTPVRFVKSGGGTSLTLDTTISFSLGQGIELERSDIRVLVRHEVSLRGAVARPKADKRSTQRFSLSDIVKKGGAMAGTPLMYALRKAINGAMFSSGRAWIESATYDGAGRFVIVVGLSKH